MVSTMSNYKPKLPRKRKKACINVDGRKHYYNTVNLARVTGECPCKFWVLASVRTQIFQQGEMIIPMPTPTKFW